MRADCLPPELRLAALACLRVCAADDKAAAVAALVAAGVAADAAAPIEPPADLPGRPSRPLLVAPREMPTRGAGASAARIALLHALAHIEFNAINLALDAIWRFAGMPQAYYQDWLRVAGDEAHHFALLVDRLRAHGAAYGDLPAHDGLWEMAQATRGDVLARMALVPRTLEARGLDASPAVRARLAGSGDAASAAVIDVILRDEIGHVAIGNRWFRYLCDARDLDPVVAYRELAIRHNAPRLCGPFNMAARAAAGFDALELAQLQADAQGAAR